MTGTEASGIVISGPRVAISGGGGKTTMARHLAGILHVPHVELDALHWTRPNWEPPPVEEFRERVFEATAGPAWVADGNYRRVRDIVWARAQTLIYLDYPLRLVMWRTFLRTLRRARSREPLWGTQRESLRMAFASRDSLLLYIIRGSRRRRAERLNALSVWASDGRVTLRFTSPRDTETWLQEVEIAVRERQRP